MSAFDVRTIIWNLESELHALWMEAFDEKNMESVKLLDIKLMTLRELDRRIEAAQKDED